MFAGTKRIGRETNCTIGTQSRRMLQTALVICGSLLLGWLHRDLGNPEWVDAALLIPSTAFTIAALARELPLQNAIMAAVTAAFVSALAWIIGWKIGIPFGPIVIEDPGDSPILLPWLVPLIGVVIVLNSRQVARCLLRRWNLSNPGLWTIGLASLLALALDLVLVNYASGSEESWGARSSGTELTWHAVPWYILFTTPTVAALILAVCVPWLIDKRGMNTRAASLYSVWLWLAIDLFLSGANAANGWWDWAIIGLIIALVVGILSLRGMSARTS